MNGFSFDWGWDFDWSWITNPIAHDSWWILILNIGAVYRMCRVIARDDVLKRPRDHVTEHYTGAMVSLMLCMWCLSFYFGIVALFFTAWRTTHDLWLIICFVLTLSTVTGFMSESA